MSRQNINSLKAAGLTESQSQAALAAGRTAAAATVAAQTAQTWAAGVAAGMALGEHLKALRGKRRSLAAPAVARPASQAQTDHATPNARAEIRRAAEAAGASAADFAEGKALAQHLQAVRGKAYRWRAD